MTFEQFQKISGVGNKSGLGLERGDLAAMGCAQLMRYLDVVEGLRAQLSRGDVAAGGALASESEIGAAFGASRATVRKALELLRNDGLVFSRRGSGWFAAHDPVHQALGRVTTVEAALEAAGAVPQRRVLQFAFEPANSEVAGELRIAAQAEVLRVRRLNLADGQPFAVVTVWLPGELGRYLSRAEVAVGDVVHAGTRLGSSGSSGRSTGPHLHFELWENGVAKDPLGYRWHAPSQAASDRLAGAVAGSF